ncbi:MAG: hypothetical protein CVU00_02640 [Bacteroidetes bacterium HGW-Bacteroidetes-17]|jgi:uncharacterized protein (DUF488 family)|nr:MAG: hypothetical protein CVU00_02640 [Bacteroidetes bacterium HGW-Bacteroidetes-17]
MLYRKKILLAIVELFGREINATDFQKILFLFSEKQIDRKYDFVPYKYGCFSFQAMADKNSLIKEGYLANTRNWKINIDYANFINTLNEIDRKTLSKLKQQIDNFSTEELIRQVYLNYPYFAINSEIVSKYLNEKETQIVNRFKPQTTTEGIFTIGYEGKSIEKYLNTLIQQNIKILCDVRKNPLSRKYGFAKRTLQNACESVNIKYIHLPELGIISEKRKNLITQNDYDNLFVDYEKEVLPNQQKEIMLIHNLIKTYGRVALTCYEALPKQCHRTKVADAVHSLDLKIPIIHL